MGIRILVGDMRERLRALDDASIDSCVCDPPYHLISIVKRFGSPNAAPAKVGKTGAYARASKGFMGQTWDGGDVAFRAETWAEVYRVLKPGAHLAAFSGTRTYHRMVCAIEDAGFEIRDQLAWAYGSGFPKSHNLSGEHQGCGTALKPSWEPICLARKPLAGTVAKNMAAYGTGALNIDGCRIDSEKPTGWAGAGAGGNTWNNGNMGFGKDSEARPVFGRWPANLIHDGSDEVLAGFPATSSGMFLPHHAARGKSQIGTFDIRDRTGEAHPTYGDSGSAARFFYCAKATRAERGEGNHHPTVKPGALMRWLCRLVTPCGGTVLDPFAGSGSTLIAADAEQFDAIGIELSPDYAAIAERRVRDAARLFANVRTA